MAMMAVAPIMDPTPLDSVHTMRSLAIAVLLLLALVALVAAEVRACPILHNRFFLRFEKS